MTPTDIRDTAIPKDVMEAARAFLLSDPADYISHRTALRAIARAIMAATEAERERCAKIAEEEMCGDDYGAVAAAIRAGTKGASHG